MANNLSSFFSLGQHEVGHFCRELNTVRKTDKWSCYLRKTKYNLGSRENTLNITTYHGKTVWPGTYVKKKKTLLGLRKHHVWLLIPAFVDTKMAGSFSDILLKIPVIVATKMARKCHHISFDISSSGLSHFSRLTLIHHESQLIHMYQSVITCICTHKFKAHLFCPFSVSPVL